MIISLGIESTAHTFSIGIVDEEGKIYSNDRIIFKTEKGGIHPRDAAELHSKEAKNVLERALNNGGFLIKKIDNKIIIYDALFELSKYFENSIIRYHEEPWNRYRYLLLENGIEIRIENNRVVSNDKNYKRKSEEYLKDINDFERYINLISYSAGPGLYPTLLQGYFVAKLLSKKLDVPIIGVNHLISHVEIVKMYNKFYDPLVLLVSGANTMLITYANKRYRIIGETLDIGVGNFLDKVGRLLGIGFPAGPKIEEFAKKGKNIIDLPYNVKGLNLHFGGLYTHIKRIIESKNYDIYDLCFSIQETVFAMLDEIVERAIAYTGKKEFGLTGGVAANKRLQEIFREMAKERGIKFGTVPIDLANDNGAMIAWTGILWFKNNVEGEKFINMYWRPESVELKI